MTDRHVQIVLKLDARNPIEIGDFVGAFTSLSTQFERHIERHNPDLSPDARIYVSEVKSGSIIASLLPWAMSTLAASSDYMSQILVLEKFIEIYGQRISTYFQKGGRVEDATKSELKEFADAVAAIANDPNGNATIEAAVFEDGKKDVRAAFTFTTREGKTAQEEIENHRRELDKRESADHERVLMVFSQSNVKDTKIGSRTGERVIIEAISSRDLPLVYASALAEERIKHEIRDSEENVFKKAFDVDVNVELLGGRPTAYRVVQVHNVIIIDE